MEGGQITLAALSITFLVGLSRAMILFIVTSGLSFVLGVLRVPNVAHGSLYMIGAFSAFSISSLLGGGTAGFWIALILAPFIVALVSLIAERSLFCHLYQREHLMLLLFTFALMLILGDLVKIIWGADYRSIMAPEFLKGSVPLFGSSFPCRDLQREAGFGPRHDAAVHGTDVAEAHLVERAGGERRAAARAAVQDDVAVLRRAFIACQDLLDVELEQSARNQHGTGQMAAPELGRFAINKDFDDLGSFKTSTLRNIAVTAPYMHDGSVATLRDAVVHYNNGGVTNEGDPVNDFLSGGIRPLNLEEDQIDDLVAFLEALTSPEFEELVKKTSGE